MRSYGTVIGPRLASVALVLAGAVGAGWTMHVREASAAERRRTDAARARVAMEAAALARTIEDFESAARRDTANAFFRARLASLYLQRARASGSFEDVLLGERLARRSLAVRRAHNDEAALALAASLIAQHRFAEARLVAGDLVTRAPDAISHKALLGEILLELGDYDVARPLFDSVRAAGPALATAARVSRWLELTGHTAAARRAIRAAGEEVIHLDHLSREQVAWYYLRMGNLEWRDGHVEAAERAYTEGLGIVPDDFRLLAARARLAAARGRWRDAVADAERSLAVTLDPGALIVLEEAWRALGDTARESQYAKALDLVFDAQAGPPHREVSLHFIDRGRHLDVVLARARSELTVRRDPYGYDVTAWALHAAGRKEEAMAMADSSLARGTTDALLFYHAGVIAAAGGADSTAVHRLRRALSINRWLGADRARHARVLLDSLTEER